MTHGPMKQAHMLAPIAWERETGAVRIIDQTLLPNELRYVDITTAAEMCEAIAALRVRGAPAIGVAGAFGVYLGLREVAAASSAQLLAALDGICSSVAGVRPTAVNLAWAVERVHNVVRESAARTAVGASADVQSILDAALSEAVSIMDEDIAFCHSIGLHGAGLIPDGARVLTHCNAGALATAGWGTALAPLYVRHRQGAALKVWADETRPLLQGARLTAYELSQAGIDVTVICDNMAASLMARGEVDLIIVGADRVAANGDVCNKIGTYGLACAAWIHKVPFYVACPTSTLDLSLPTGADIPIEQRDADEVACGFGRRTVPEGVKVFNPAFDVTPARMITAIVTERGIVRPPFAQGLMDIM